MTAKLRSMASKAGKIGGKIRGEQLRSSPEARAYLKNFPMTITEKFIKANRRKISKVNDRRNSDKKFYKKWYNAMIKGQQEYWNNPVTRAIGSANSARMTPARIERNKKFAIEGMKALRLPENVRKQKEAVRLMFLLHPERHPNYKMPNVSKPQRELFALMKCYFPDAKLEYPIITKKGLRFADIGIVSCKLDIEFDGDYWHKNEQSDYERDLELAEAGWIVLRVNKEILKRIKCNGLEVQVCRQNQ